MTPTSTLSLTLDADGRDSAVRFSVRRVVNAGYAGRDQEAVKAHIEELRHEGVPPPPDVPMLFPVTADNVTTADRIEVLGVETSGEVEYVLLLTGDEVLVGVGSDHTDRALERQSLGKSKQICKNVVSPHVWRYRDLAAGWDDLLLQSRVRPAGGSEDVLYQKATLRALLHPEALIDLVRSRLSDRQCEGLVIYSGTIPLLTGRVIPGDSFCGELTDPRSERSLVCAYSPVPLCYLRGAEG
jgi:hypothetical protein